MSSLIKEAMIESYALMILVMGTFFVYFCAMVWAFSNPKLSGTEDEEMSSDWASETGESDGVSLEMCVRHGELREYEGRTSGGRRDHVVMLDVRHCDGYVNDF